MVEHSFGEISETVFGQPLFGIYFRQTIYGTVVGIKLRNIILFLEHVSGTNFRIVCNCSEPVYIYSLYSSYFQIFFNIIEILYVGLLARLKVLAQWKKNCSWLFCGWWVLCGSNNDDDLWGTTSACYGDGWRRGTWRLGHSGCLSTARRQCQLGGIEGAC